MLLTPGSGRIEVSRLARAKRYHKTARHRQVSRLNGVARAGIGLNAKENPEAAGPSPSISRKPA
jgi:hypothetical protein